ncbi:hypothetical protein [Luteolibacter sp. Populi]|uniref:hypothetical protein n=1 Tax=Luteolibacter sp. Populi TaxID=3230487 RepID=UPI0034665CB6
MMRRFTLGMVAGAGLLLAAQAEEYVLAEKGKYSQPAGTKLGKQAVLEITGAKLTLTTPEKTIEGTSTRKESRLDSIEILSPTQSREVLEKKTLEGKITLSGQDRPMPDEPVPLQAVPVLVERAADGSFTAKLEEGEPTPAQAAHLAKLVKALEGESEVALYGDTPRKPGDKWTVDPKNLRSFADAEKLTGAYTVEFVEVKDFQGTPCAVLKSTYDVKGTAIGGPEASLSFKGSAITHRSLADRADLDVKIEAAMVMEAQPGPGVTMRVEGPYKLSETVTVKRP